MSEFLRKTKAVTLLLSRYPQMDKVDRLRHPLPLGKWALKSVASEKHGLLRREQDYTPVMMVEESRMLQGSIFETPKPLQGKRQYPAVGSDVIADEVDSQLALAVTSYMSEAKTDSQPLEP